ncbi:TetR/AcrR family transcriptional regulator [Ancylobacter oerskovii]|uniref:TetR/AcrR family transcriptional regulator n=1 Tax=Ancylobacter oerskovii TaxID=459519 RepID=A0ABW4YTN7_9HYPH|nr:TetR/AcrR family transcriptional regulator [Ancylobacter oerskovii]MBS7543437.1 TetR/AcrR family transcriptional regulator [Ancylobacter oerskovii]
MAKSSGRPSKAEAALLGERILDGARAVFCERGVTNGSLDEIAARLGISKHTLYRRHANKEALLQAVVERDIGRFRQALCAASEAAAPAGPVEVIRQVALHYVEIGASRAYAGFYLSLCAEAVRSSPLRARLAQWSLATLEPLVAAVEAAMAAGRLRPGDPKRTAGILVDLLEGVNNRIRLGDDAAAAELPALFEERWAAFVSAMRAPP